MKKRRIFLGCICGMLLVCGTVLLGRSFFQKEEWEGLEVINISCDRTLYESLEEIEEEATIIVEVEARDTVEQVVSTFYDSVFKQNYPEAGYTKRELEVEKVYKGDVSVGDKIVLMQDYFIWAEDNGEKKLMSLTELKPMKKGEKYLLFLAWSKNKEAYYEVGDFQGVYPLEAATVNSKDRSIDSKQEFDHVYPSESHSWTLAPIYDEVQAKYYIN